MSVCIVPLGLERNKYKVTMFPHFLLFLASVRHRLTASGSGMRRSAAHSGVFPLAFSGAAVGVLGWKQGQEDKLTASSRHAPPDPRLPASTVHGVMPSVVHLSMAAGSQLFLRLLSSLAAAIV